MMRRMLAAMMVLGLMLATGGRVWGQEPEPAPRSRADLDKSLSGRSGYFNLGGAGGFTVSPDMTLGLISLDYYVTDDIAVGPYFHIGGDGRNHFWGVTGQVKFCAALQDNPDIRPYATIGIGFGHIKFKDGKDADTYLFPVGGGFEFALTDIVSLDTGTLFEITQDTFAGLVVGVRVLL